MVLNNAIWFNEVILATAIIGGSVAKAGMGRTVIG